MRFRIIIKPCNFTGEFEGFYFEKRNGSPEYFRRLHVSDSKNRQERYHRGDIRLPVSGSLDHLLNLIGGSLGGTGTLHLKINRKIKFAYIEVVANKTNPSIPLA